ncbi:MAG: RNA-binding transcriptional accessory protein, partial [Clostridia bacterium]|nr:RNA-binding transcriptional accessory protein [Clostridia bacterium]
MTIIEILAQELNLKPDQVERTVALIDEGNTIPFIARYRKEVTGSLDDTVLRQLDERLTSLRKMEARREEIRNLIAAQEKLTPEIEQAIAAAKTMTELEDIYRPFRPHRKTRASIAREKGLEPLAA